MRIYPFFLAAAGCPGRCLYCRQELAAAAEELSPAAVTASLDALLPRQGDGEIAFYGGSFTLLPPARQRAYLAAAASFVAAGRVAGLRISTRPDALAQEQVELLASCGVTTVEVGAQSFDARVLQRAGRGYAPETVTAAVSCLQRRGFAVGLQLMPFLPGGDRREALASLAQALWLGPDFLRIYPTVVLRDTPLAGLAASGLYRPATLRAAIDCSAEMLWRCRRHGTPVIRLGLQGTPELEAAGAVVAGPYHPAFGQLVRSRLWFRAFLAQQHGRGAAFRVAPSDLADARGQKRGNLVQLLRRWPRTSIAPDPELARGWFRTESATCSLMTLNLYQE